MQNMYVGQNNRANAVVEWSVFGEGSLSVYTDLYCIQAIISLLFS